MSLRIRGEKNHSKTQHWTERCIWIFGCLLKLHRKESQWKGRWQEAIVNEEKREEKADICYIYKIRLKPVTSSTCTDKMRWEIVCVECLQPSVKHSGVSAIFWICSSASGVGRYCILHFPKITCPIGLYTDLLPPFVLVSFYWQLLNKPVHVQ